MVLPFKSEMYKSVCSAPVFRLLGASVCVEAQAVATHRFNKTMVYLMKVNFMALNGFEPRMHKWNLLINYSCIRGNYFEPQMHA
jgi:hypothetical protein